MNKQRARTDIEKEYRKKQLKKAALPLFAQKGFKSTTVEMITRKAHLSPAAFYLYFTSKIAIYRELNKDGIQILEGLLNKSLYEAQDNPVDKLYALAYAYFKFFNEYKEYFYITEILHLGNDEFFYNTQNVAELEARTLALLSLVANVIQEGIKQKTFKTVDPMKTAITLWGMIDGVLLLEVKKTTVFTKCPIEMVIQHMVDIAISGIRKVERHNA